MQEKVHPTEIRCLIRLDEERKKTASGIIIPDSVTETRRLGQRFAELLEVGGNAFEGWNPPVPRPGDRVMVNKYEAEPVSSRLDERECLINDKGIGAIVSKITIEALKKRDADG